MAKPKVGTSNKPSIVPKKTFCCTLCTYSTDYHHNLRFHAKSIHNNILSKLECCNIRFIDIEALKMHFTEFHIQRYKCELCHRGFYNKGELNMHVNSCGKTVKVKTSNSLVEKKTFCCTLCTYSTDYHSRFRLHANKIHKKYICKFQCCDIRFLDEETFKMHLAEFHIPRYNCELCHVGFYNETELNRHAKCCGKSTEVDTNDSIIEKKTFSCTLCTFSTDYHHNIRFHAKNFHNKRLSKLECCDIRFLDKDAFKMHLAEFHIPRYKCDLCHRAFYTNGILNMHVNSCGKIAKVDTSDSIVEIKTFCCTLCTYSTDYHRDLRIHSKKRHNKYICKFECCDIRFSDDEAFKKHLTEFHIPRYNCELCHVGFYNETELNRHAKCCGKSTDVDTSDSIIEKKTFCCTLCTFSTDYHHNVRVHAKNVHDKILSKLECCDICFSNEEAFKMHLAEFHIPRYKCELCQRAFYNKGRLKLHVLSCGKIAKGRTSDKPCILEKKTFSCTVCTFSTDYHKNLRLHAKKFHNKKLSKFECCDIRFLDKEAYQMHLAEFHIPRYNCELCHSAYYTRTKLNTHVNSCGKNKQMPCIYCDFTTNVKATLLKHKQENHQIASKTEWLKCQKCPYETKWLECFRRHVRRHEVSSTLGEKKTFSCTLCTFSTDYRSNIRLHARNVHKKNPSEFECCDICFSDKEALRKHTAEFHIPRYNCELCHSAYYTRTKLNTHVNSCGKTKKMPCIYCDFTTNVKATLLKHKQENHQIASKAEWFKCQKCPYETKWLHCFKRHARRHEVPSTVSGNRLFSKFKKQKSSSSFKLSFKKKLFKCKNGKCSFKTKWAASLRRHLRRLHEVPSTSWSSNGKKHVRNLHKAKPSLEDHVESTDEYDEVSQKPVAVDASPVRLTRSSRSQQADIAAEFTHEDKLTATEKKQGSRKRKYGESNNGEECDMSKNRAILNVTRDLVEEGLRLRNGCMEKEQMSPKYRNRSLSLGERHSTALASRKNSNSQILSADASNGLLMLDSDEEADQSSSQKSLVMNKTELLQTDLKERVFCPVCPHNTIYPGNLKKHVKILHGGISKYKCVTCPQKFDSPYVLQTHQLTHQMARCNFCKFTTYHEVKLKQHMKWKHNFEYSLTIPLKESNLDYSTRLSVNLQPVVVLKRIVVNLALKETENEIINLKETNDSDHDLDRSISESDDIDRDGAISESDHSFYSTTVRRNGQLATEKTPPSMNESYCPSPGSKLVINSIHDEARQLRAQILQTMAISDVLPLFQRLLEMSCSLTNLIRETTEVESRFQTIETFEYVWHTSKTAVARWKELKGLMNHDTSLNAVTYAYTTLPLFNNWEKSDHLEMLGNVILLLSNTVKNLQLKPSNQSESGFSETNFSFKRTVNDECQSSILCAGPSSACQVKKENVASVVVETMKKANVSSVESPKKTNLASLKEFCRLANIATWQNTKCRSERGFKDDYGDYHAMYRIEIGKMLSHFCPADVTHLKCCGKVLDLIQLKEHVNERHEAGRPNRREPSISPA